MATVRAFPGLRPQVMWPQTLGPCPRLSARGGWRMRQNLCARRSPPRRGCFVRWWPRSTRTSCTRFRLVREERRKSCPQSSGLLHVFSLLVCFVSVALVSGQHGRAFVAGGGGSCVGGGRHCGSCLRCGDACCGDFCPGGCCGIGQCRPLHQGCRRPGRLGREGGTGGGIKGRGEECHGVSLYSRERRRPFLEGHPPRGRACSGASGQE
jgi:hypothetical protein